MPGLSQQGSRGCVCSLDFFAFSGTVEALKDKLILQGKITTGSTVSKWPFTLAFCLPSCMMCVARPCLAASIIMCHLAMQQASSMGALEAGLDGEDAGWGAPAGIRNVFACFNTLH